MIDAGYFKQVEKLTMVLAIAVIALAAMLASQQFLTGISVGAGLMVVNAYLLRRIGERVFRTFKRPGLAVLFFNVKMFALVALIFALLKYLALDPVAFVAGISIFPLAIVGVALRHGLSQSAADVAPPSGPTDTPTETVDDKDSDRNG